jgi:heat-inducible transcriptional repressor
MVTSRQLRILQAAVEVYLETGRPVSSAAVLERTPDLKLSPASVRAEMAALEERGTLRQPHTSAGRVPTDLGLRTYLDACLTPKLHPWDRTNLDAAAGSDPAAFAASLGQRIAGITSEMTVVAVPRFLRTAIKEVGLTRLKPCVFVAFFVAPGGLVQQKLVQVDFDLTPEELTRIQNFLNERLAGRTLDEVRRQIEVELADDAAQHDHMRRSALEIGIRALPEPELELVVEGASHLASKPELSPKLHALLEAIEQKQVLLKLLDHIVEGTGEVHVVLGSEHHVTELPEIACIGTSLSGAGSGAITVMGAVRMDYGRLVPLVRYAAQLFGRHWEPL